MYIKFPSKINIEIKIIMDFCEQQNHSLLSLFDGEKNYWTIFNTLYIYYKKCYLSQYQNIINVYQLFFE